MPICSRCGKPLSTQQALEYHLRKKKKCTTIFNCKNCNKDFASNMEMLYHQMTCNMELHKIASIMKQDDENSVFITDTNFEILYTDEDCEYMHYLDRIHPDFRIDSQKHLSIGTIGNLTKLWNSRPVYISSMPQNNTLVIIEKPYTRNTA